MMSTNNGRGEQVSVSEEGPERSGGPPPRRLALTQKYRKRPSAGSSVPSTNSVF